MFLAIRFNEMKVRIWISLGLLDEVIHVHFRKDVFPGNRPAPVCDDSIKERAGYTNCYCYSSESRIHDFQYPEESSPDSDEDGHGYEEDHHSIP